MNEMTALVVDDEEIVRKYLSDVLKRRYENVIIAQNVSEALALLANNKIDIMITDMQMPEASGIDLITKIRETNNEVAIIVTSGKEFSEDDMMLLLAKSVYGFLFKPSTVAEIFSCLDQVEQTLKDRSKLKY